MCYILLKAISKLCDFDYNQKLYQYYKFIVTNYNNIIYLKFYDNVKSHKT